MKQLVLVSNYLVLMTNCLTVSIVMTVEAYSDLANAGTLHPQLHGQLRYWHLRPIMIH